MALLRPPGPWSSDVTRDRQRFWARSAPVRSPAGEEHLKRARYFRAMALSASTTDVAITSILLAQHYERLARSEAPSDLAARYDHTKQVI
jgi:hypothetical protein